MSFKIVGGVLRFKNSPNYEEPQCVTGGDNVSTCTWLRSYASDGTNSSMEEVTFEVTNVEERGVVTLSTLQPQVEVHAHRHAWTTLTQAASTDQPPLGCGSGASSVIVGAIDTTTYVRP